MPQEEDASIWPGRAGRKEGEEITLATETEAEAIQGDSLVPWLAAQ